MFNSDSKEIVDIADNFPLKDIILKDNTGKIVTSTETLNFELGNRQMTLTDENDKPLPIDTKGTSEKVIVRIKDDRYKDYILTVEKSILKVEKNSIILFFKLSSKGITLVDYKGYEVQFDPVEKWGFEGKEKIGSSRGYIWSRSIPLLKNTKILGHGPDTFAIYFPQNDVSGKYYAYGEMWHNVDKPHSLYLQVGINTGIISLIAILVLFIMYFISSIRVYISNEYKDFTP